MQEKILFLINELSKIKINNVDEIFNVMFNKWLLYNSSEVTANGLTVTGLNNLTIDEFNNECNKYSKNVAFCAINFRKSNSTL
jgi:hypothetical protein